MTRRTFLAVATALMLSPFGAQANMIDYIPGAAEEAINSGQTVLLDFAADWCSTCRSQERTINALVEENPAYGEMITFYRVDWDDYGRGSLASQLRIPRRSTLVLFRDGQEVSRLIADTRESAIRGLLDGGM